MKSSYPRNREHRTKRMPAEAMKVVKIPLDQADYDRFKELERNRHITKEEIFLSGMQTCANQ